MPLTYTWSRTVIAGDPNPMTYACRDGDRTVGRVYHHYSKGWFWCMQAGGPNISRTK
jgi:hypothetical protein